MIRNTGQMPRARRILPILLAFFLVAPVFAASPPPKAKEEKFGALDLRFVLKGKGQPASGAQVTLEGREHPADAEGRLRIPKVRARPYIVSAELYRKEGGFLGLFGARTVRYIGFREVFVDPDKTASETVEIDVVADLDGLCASCHPLVRTREHRVVKCVHESNVELQEKNLEKIREFNAENSRNRKEGKKYFPDIVTEKRVVKVEDKDTVRYFLVCESCHTIHRNAGPRAFVKMDFEDRSVLCRGCHP